MKADTYAILGTVEHYSDGVKQLGKSGDCVLVARDGRERQLLIQCPDGCGEVLSINLDRRSGPAWHLYWRKGDYALFPSVDKPTGCRSHFILSRGRIIWCDWAKWDDGATVQDQIDDVVRVLTDEFTPFVEIADRLEAIPWDVMRACKILARRGVADEGRGKLRGHFRRHQLSTPHSGHPASA